MWFWLVSSSNKQYNASSGGTNNRGSESGTTNSDVTPDRPLGSSNGSSGVPSRGMLISVRNIEFLIR